MNSREAQALTRYPIQELFDLTGQVALVTGASNLGYDAAEALIELGAVVYLTRRNAEEAVRTASRLADATGGDARGIALEATDEQDWKRAVDAIVQECGKLDILINNAGGRRVGNDPPVSLTDDLIERFLEAREVDDWQYTLESNLTSVFLGCRTVVPHMKERHSGKIVNIASIDGIVGRDLRIYPGTGLSPTVPDYLAGKAGVIGLTRGLAAVLASAGIYVNSISPGGFYRGQPDEFVNRYSRLVPLGRMGRDRIDLKGAIAYLASPASDYTVGHNLVVDGGFSAW